jgi:hypothetical protein
VQDYFDAHHWTDGLPIVPPTEAAVSAMLKGTSHKPDEIVTRAMSPEGWPVTVEKVAINGVMAGAPPEAMPVLLGAIEAFGAGHYASGVRSTNSFSFMQLVNGPIARELGMNSGTYALGPGNRANATIGRAIRLVLLNVGGGWPGDLDKSTLGHPGKYTYAIAENEQDSPWAPYHVEKGFAPDASTVFVIAAESPHSVTNHVADDPEGILDSICSAMSTVANNNAVSSGHCAVAIGPEHAQTIAGKGWTRHDVRNYLHMNAWNLFRDLAFDHRYGRIYNRNLPRWYRRDSDSRIPIVPSPDHIHLFVIGGTAGRFSAFIPGWGHMTAPVLRSIESTGSNAAPVCVDGTCYL